MDRRSLGVFRITFGLLLIIHAITHLRFYAGLYANDGVLPSRLLTQSTEIPYFPSMLTWLEQYSWGFPAFLAMITVSYVAFTIGWKTRLATLVSLFAFSTICHRNPYLVIGGDEVIGSMLLWSCLVPLGAQFSIDARHGAGRTRIPCCENSDSRLASLGILLQLSMVYFATAWQKSGPTWWSDGMALIRIIGMTTYRLPGTAVLEALPVPVLLWLSRSIVVLEYALPLLILSPLGQPSCRRLAIVCIASLHIGIALTTDTGLFSLTMLAFIPLLLSPHDWDALQRFALGRRWVHPKECDEATIVASQPLSCWQFEMAAAFLLLGFLEENWNKSFASPNRRVSISAIALPWRFAAAAQRWSMFAPDPPLYDSHLTVKIQFQGASLDVWDNQSAESGLESDRQVRSDFLWKLFVQRAALMHSPERQNEGIELRLAICEFFARDYERSIRTVSGESLSGESPTSIDHVELWVTLTPTEAWYSSNLQPESACVARYIPNSHRFQ